jgi:histone deacetylase 1/2
MEQPTGFVDFALPTHVCHLYKSLYGLKQAPRAWYTSLSDFLLNISFQASKIDTPLFILTVNHDLSGICLSMLMTSYLLVIALL